MSQTADIYSKKVSMQTFTPSAYAGYHSYIVENLTPSFALVYKMPLAAGKQRPGLAIPLS